MKRSNLNSTIQTLNNLNRQLDDIKDILKQDGMTHFIERSFNQICLSQDYLNDTIKFLNEYKASKQLENQV